MNGGRDYFVYISRHEAFLKRLYTHKCKIHSPKHCLDRFIDIHSVLFIDFRFVNQILFKLPSVHGVFKTYCLEILYSRVEQIPNLFTELRTKGLKDILTHR